MIDVNISKINGELIVILSDNRKDIDESNFDYAFYLYHDGKIIDRRWYSEKKDTVFNIEKKQGIFYVRCFVRNNLNASVKGYNSKKLSVNALPYNIQSWDKNVIKINDIDSFENLTSITDGIYQFSINGTTVDFLFEGLERLSNTNGILVCFSGAITDREHKYAPFFSGLGIAKKLEAPLIAVADPALAMSHQLALGWYAGNEDIHNLPSYIARILERVSKKLHSKLTLFGGSGGGFAALSIAKKMSIDTNVVVWNPQTSIALYLKPSVEMYLKLCFSNYNPLLSLYDNLETLEITHDLLKAYKSNERKSNVLYLQNTGDKMHLQSHAIPLMSLLKAKQTDANIYTTSQGVTFWIKHWGEGHIVPNEDVILTALGEMLEGNDSESIATLLA